MATFDDDDDFEESWEPTRSNKQQLPSGLRRYINKLEKEHKSLTEEKATLQRTTRTQTIKDVLAAKGIDPRVAAFIPSDVDPSQDAVERWVDEYGDLFAGLKTAGEPVNTDPATVTDPRTGEVSTLPPGQTAQTYTLDDVNAAQRMNYAQQGGIPVEVAGDLVNKIAGAQTLDELNALTGNTVRSRVNQ